MPLAMKASRTQLWMDSLGEWSWPGRAAEAVEALPPAWVPAFPPRLAVASTGAPTQATAQQPRLVPRALGAGALLSALLATCAVLALQGALPVQRLLALQGALPVQRLLGLRSAAPRIEAAGGSVAPAPSALPTLVATSHDAAGSSIDTATYSSAALAGEGSFVVYLPPGFGATTRHYPVIYLLHGNSQRATAFLELGLQDELDRLIARHEMPPAIAVMVQGGRGANNWRDQGSRRYEFYVLEVQQLIDRMLPTVPARGARAILGDSMGGYGAMNVALGHPQRFSIVESWLGFFNGLSDELRSARPVIEREDLNAYVYGGESDSIADPAENAPFAAALRAAGATAHGAVYPGGHTMETLRSQLPHMLAYVGRSLTRNIRAQRAGMVRSAAR